MCLNLPRLLSLIIRGSQRTPLGAFVKPQSFGIRLTGRDRLAAAKEEFANGPRFFDHYRGRITADQLNGRRILDVGCGFGGRPAYYALRCGALEVVGVEPSPDVIQLCRDFAQEVECPNVAFRVGIAERLPFDDATFDMVIAYDVMEHVQDPRSAFSEVQRVLRQSGTALLVFPTYLGARSAHLDFITRIPGLHRIFDPDTIVTVVNRELSHSGGRFGGVQSLSKPAVSALNHYTLPNLNGITRLEAMDIMAEVGLRITDEQIVPFVRSTDPIPGARVLSQTLDRWHSRRTLPELLIGSLAYKVVRA
jgi:ubiquinone/menaquinone biosynthesis C-methylase UbiE